MVTSAITMECLYNFNATKSKEFAIFETCKEQMNHFPAHESCAVERHGFI